MIKNTRKSKTPVVKTDPAKAAGIQIGAAPEVKTLVQTNVVTTKPALSTGHIFLELVKPEAKKVCVAGTFNGWRPENAPMVSAGNGRWVGNLTVKPGRYEYLFVVDGQWLPDPNAKETVQNPFGGRNSVLTVSA